jgi:hypothetical protein
MLAGQRIVVTIDYTRTSPARYVGAAQGIKLSETYFSMKDT